MMRTILLKIFELVLITAISVGAMTSMAADAPSPYQYERRDKAGEHKRYLKKLNNENKKADSAIANTKLLIDKSKDRPYLPELYLRLAELYIEKSRIVFFLNQNLTSGGKPDLKTEERSSLDQFESTLFKNKAIEVYQRILDQFPGYEARDKVHFFLAHEFRELQRIEEMTLHYRAIIKEHPQSGYAAEAYLLLGDYFIGQKELAMAKHHYKAVLAHTGNPAVPIARYKLAWCFVNANDYENAMALFEASVKSTVESGDLDIDTYKRVDVKLESLIDMAYCYPEVYKKSTAEQALAYFEDYSWSRRTYTVVLEKLASRYYAKKKWEMAAPIYRKLAQLRQDPKKLLEYIGRIFECAQALNRFESADIDVELIVKALKSQQASTHIAGEDKEKNIKEYEVYARHLITRLHDAARKEKASASFEKAADAYKRYLDFFTESPMLAEMTANYAESLFACRRYLAAGKQYELLIASGGLTGREKRENHYSAVSAYYKSLKRKETLNYYQTAYAREGLRSVGRQYAKAYPTSIHTPDVLFNVAWVAYDAGRLDDAIAEFSQFTKRYPNTKATRAAVHLTLDAYHQKEDFDGLIAYGNRVLAKGGLTSPKLRSEISKIVSGAEGKIVSSLTLAAVEDWEKGKSALFETARKSNSSGLGEQALATLVVSSLEKKDLPAFFDAGDQLVTRYPQTKKSKDVLGRMIDTALGMGQFRLLADYLETFARQFPKDENTPESLLQAARIRENLGDHKTAGHDYRLLLIHGGLDRKQREDIIFRLAEGEEAMGNPTGAVEVLGTYYQDLSTNKKVHADARRAVLSFQAKSYSQAYTYLDKARRHYTKAMGKSAPRLAEDMAQVVYRETFFKGFNYKKLSFSGKIDNKIMANKTRLLKDLEERYGKVIEYQASIWALKACVGIAEANEEYARFLKEAPLPEMNAAEKAQYMKLIGQKADTFNQKADQYRQTAARLAQKWELCDPEVGKHLGQRSVNPAHFGKGETSLPLPNAWQEDKELLQLHQRVLADPKEPAVMNLLARAYLRKGDYSHAGVISKNGLANIESGQEATRASLYNILGLVHIQNGDDDRARETFKRALQSNRNNIAAQINLAGLYNHYGHQERARQIYLQAGGSDALAKTTEMIHPHAKELYDARREISKR